MLQHRWNGNGVGDPDVVLRECEGMTASRPQDLFVPVETNGSSDQADALMKHIRHHGMGIFRNILSRETAQTLRDHVVARNENINVMENIPVIQGENRWSVGLQASKQPVLRALFEITSHSQLTTAVEGLLGVNPAIVELSTISSVHGARAQHFHADTEFAASALATNHFAPLYTILIPLQDTFPSQGATWVCPGTHGCRRGKTRNFCDDLGFPLATSEDGAVWKTGDALMYSSAMQHRGGAHGGGPDRVALLLTVASRPEFAHQLPLGPVYGIRWDHWGSCWSDWRNYTTARKASIPLIRTLRALGVTQFPGSHRGWTFVQSAIARMMNDMYYFRLRDLESFVHGQVGFLGKLPWFVQGRVEASGDYASWPLYLADICRNIRNTLLVTLLILVTFYIHLALVSSKLRLMMSILVPLMLLSLLSYAVILLQKPWTVDWDPFHAHQIMELETAFEVNMEL